MFIAKEEVMIRSVLLAVMIAVGLVGVGEAQIAEGERIVEIWTCTVNEGSTIDDVGRITTRWNAFVQAAGATDVQSFILSHLIGTVRGHEMVSDVTTSFLFLDSFPDAASWAAAKRAEATPAGQELVAAFTQANTCTANTLYRGRQYN